MLEHLLQYLDTAGTGFVGLEASLGCERPWNLMPFVTAKRYAVSDSVRNRNIEVGLP